MRTFLRRFGIGRKHGEDGLEYPDPRPVELPSGMKRPESLQDMVARMVQNERFKEHVAAQGFESDDEAADFEVDNDDPEEVFSDHERMAARIMESEDVVHGREVRKRIDEAVKRRRAGRNSDAERGRGERGVEEDADREREYRGRREGGRGSYRKGDQPREDEDADERR